MNYVVIDSTIEALDTEFPGFLLEDHPFAPRSARYLASKKSAFVQVEVGVLIRKLLESPGSKVLLMDKIRLTTKDDEYPIIYRVLTIPGGCLGFLNHQQYLEVLSWPNKKIGRTFWGLPCASPLSYGGFPKMLGFPNKPSGFSY